VWRMKRWVARMTSVALLVMAPPAVTHAAMEQTSAIPAGVQLLLFNKIWMFDRSVHEGDQIVMAVLYQSTFRASEEAKDQLAEAVRAGGLNIRCVPVALDEVGNVVNTLERVKADVFYVTEMRGVNILDVVRVSRARHIKTITVAAGYVEGGIAIGLRVRNDKPVIVVNLKAAKAEGSDLTAQLLQVSTIIEGSTGSNRPSQ
jgi:hypothetical protein